MLLRENKKSLVAMIAGNVCLLFQEMEVEFFEIAYFYFLLPVPGRRSFVFESNFRNGDFDGFTRFEVSRIRKSYF